MYDNFETSWASMCPQTTLDLSTDMSYMTPKPASYGRRDSIFSSVSNSSGLSGSEALWSSSPSAPGQESSHERNHTIPLHAYEGPVTPQSRYHHEHGAYLHRSLNALNTHDWPNPQAHGCRIGNSNLKDSRSTSAWDMTDEENCFNSLPSPPLMSSYVPVSEHYSFHANQPLAFNARPADVTSSPIFSDLENCSFSTAATWGTVSPASTITGSDSSFMTDTTTFRQDLINSFDAFGMEDNFRNDTKCHTGPADLTDDFVMVSHVPQTPTTSPARRSRVTGRGRITSAKRRGPTKKATKDRLEKISPHLSVWAEVIDITCHDSEEKKYCPHKTRAGTPCKQGFNRQEHLTRHIETHFRTKYFKCAVGWKYPEVCNKTLGRHDNRIQHYVTHITCKRNGNKERSEVFDAIREYAPLERYTTATPEKQIASILHQLNNPHLTMGSPKTTKPGKAKWPQSKL